MPLRENLWRDTVEKLEMREMVCVPPTETILAAVKRMQDHRTGCVFIEDGGKLAGIFTERDLLRRVIGKRLDMGGPISTVMTANPASARQDESIGSVLQKLHAGGYRHVPVLDNRSRLVGWVSVREIVHYMVEHFPKAVYNLPPKPDQVPVSPDGG